MSKPRLHSQYLPAGMRIYEHTLNFRKTELLSWSFNRMTSSYINHIIHCRLQTRVEQQCGRSCRGWPIIRWDRAVAEHFEVLYRDRLSEIRSKSTKLPGTYNAHGHLLLQLRFIWYRKSLTTLMFYNLETDIYKICVDISELFDRCLFSSLYYLLMYILK